MRSSHRRAATTLEGQILNCGARVVKFPSLDEWLMNPKQKDIAATFFGVPRWYRAFQTQIKSKSI